MIIKGSTKVIGILGYPIEHSMSPVMHNQAFDTHQANYVYVPLETKPGDLKQAVDGLRAMNFVGANVTIPHKEKIIPYLDEISTESEKIGAVNTIINRHGHLIGTTTDGLGFKKAYLENGFTFKNQSIAIIGTGGAARTIAFALMMPKEAKQITLVGRNETRLEEIKTEISKKLQQEIKTIHLRDIAQYAESFDLYVQTTSLGMKPNTLESALHENHLFPHQTVYDIVYNPEETKLIQMAKEKGLKTVGGLGMLVHQGLASLEMWTGLKADPQIFYQSLKNSLY